MTLNCLACFSDGAASTSATEFDAERYFRDAPLMIVGEDTNEIQCNVIAGQLVSPPIQVWAVKVLA